VQPSGLGLPTETTQKSATNCFYLKISVKGAAAKAGMRCALKHKSNKTTSDAKMEARTETHEKNRSHHKTLQAG
jgi:hypothetical protein